MVYSWIAPVSFYSCSYLKNKPQISPQMLLALRFQLRATHLRSFEKRFHIGKLSPPIHHGSWTMSLFHNDLQWSQDLCLIAGLSDLTRQLIEWLHTQMCALCRFDYLFFTCVPYATVLWIALHEHIQSFGFLALHEVDTFPVSHCDKRNFWKLHLAALLRKE